MTALFCTNVEFCEQAAPRAGPAQMLRFPALPIAGHRIDPRRPRKSIRNILYRGEEPDKGSADVRPGGFPEFRIAPIHRGRS